MPGVVLTLVAWLCCGAASPAQTVVQTNIVGGANGTNTTNDTAGYSGLASVALGLGQGGFVSTSSIYLLSVTGDVREASDLEQHVANGLDMGLSHASIVSQEKTTASQAAVADVKLTASGRSFFGFGRAAPTNITADFVMSEANASCFTNETTNGVTRSGTSQINGLTVDGQPVAVTGEANQFVTLSGGAFLVINEQLPVTTVTSIGDQSFTAEGIAVNALHVIMPFSGVNVIFGATAAGVACGPETNKVCGDFVTGGGWITGTPSGAKANFGVAGGIKNGAFWGHLSYIDHGKGMHVKATAVTGYEKDPNDPDCRIIDYAVTVDGQPGTARVRVCDKGGPGLNDRFEIQITTCPMCASAYVGYFASGDLGGSRAGGGNIQLHKYHE